MDKIFRVGGHGGPPATDAYVDRCSIPLVPVTSQVVALVRSATPDALEVIHDGHPTFCVDDAPFIYVAAFTSHTNLGFFDGFALDDPGTLLEGQGKRMRHIKLRPGADLDEAALRRLVSQAHALKQRALEEEGSAP